MSPVSTGLVYFLKLRANFLGWITVIAIVVLSILPNSALTPIHFKDLLHLDKLGHLGFYGAATFFFLIAPFQKETRSRRNLTICAGLSLLGIVLECFQDWIGQGRKWDTLDLLANFLGIILAFLFFLLFKSKFQLDSLNQ